MNINEKDISLRFSYLWHAWDWFYSIRNKCRSCHILRKWCYCNKQKCWVNWGQAWSEGVKRWGDNLFGSFSGGSI